MLAQQQASQPHKQCLPPPQVFEVVPSRADLPAFSSATFRVAFRPPADAQHYSQEVRLCACAKVLRNFRLAGESQLVPPWSLPVRVSSARVLAWLEFCHSVLQLDALTHSCCFEIVVR